LFLPDSELFLLVRELHLLSFKPESRCGLH
jgi:hypothetical protein